MKGKQKTLNNKNKESSYSEILKKTKGAWAKAKKETEKNRSLSKIKKFLRELKDWNCFKI